MEVSDNEYRRLRKDLKARRKRYKAQNEHVKANFDRIDFLVGRGEKPRIQEHYKRLGYSSIREYLSDLISRDMIRAGSPGLGSADGISPKRAAPGSWTTIGGSDDLPTMD